MARKMKDSGIEWIGEIPEGWEVHRMKSCISQRDGGAWGDEATGETGDCICLRIADFDYEHFRFTDSNNLTIRHYASPIIKKLLLQKNDILIENQAAVKRRPLGGLYYLTKSILHFLQILWIGCVVPTLFFLNIFSMYLLHSTKSLYTELY